MDEERERYLAEVGARIQEERRAWHRFVLDGVGAPSTPPAERRWLQIMVLPSFDPELVVTVADLGWGGDVVAQTAQCSLWVHFSRRSQRDPASWPQPPDPVPLTVRQPLSSSDAAGVWAAARLVAETEDPAGLDGMGIVIRRRLDGELEELQTWSPSRGTAERALVDMLLDMVDRADDAAMSNVVTGIRRYLH